MSQLTPVTSRPSIWLRKNSIGINRQLKQANKDILEDINGLLNPRDPLKKYWTMFILSPRQYWKTKPSEIIHTFWKSLSNCVMFCQQKMERYISSQALHIVQDAAKTHMFLSRWWGKEEGAARKSLESWLPKWTFLRLAPCSLSFC